MTLSQYLAECDHVILMKDGQIAEHGTHSQLMGRDRDYATLFNSVQQEVMPTTERMSSSSLITDLFANRSRTRLAFPTPMVIVMHWQDSIN